MLVDTFGADSTHVRNLDKHIDRLGAITNEASDPRAMSVRREAIPSTRGTTDMIIKRNGVHTVLLITLYGRH